MKRHELTVAIAGLGSWGSKLVRVFSHLERSQVGALCDKRSERLASFSALPGCPRLTARFSEALDAPGVSAVVIATPPPSHAQLALRALRAGKHVFVEKPMALCTADALLLKHEAERTRRHIMVGHILEYHPAFERLRELVEAGHLGRVRHVFSQRLGRSFRRHETAWWSLAPHDLSLLRSLFGSDPRQLRARARDSVSDDAVVAELEFPGGGTARIEVSTVDREKTRRLTVVGTRCIAVLDDQEPHHKLRLYEQPDRSANRSLGDWRPRSAGLDGFPVLLGLKCSAVEVSPEEPLVREVRHFVDAILDETPIRTGADSGLAVIRLLETGKKSLQSGGRGVLSGANRSGELPTPPA